MVRHGKVVREVLQAENELECLKKIHSNSKSNKKNCLKWF